MKLCPNCREEYLDHIERCVPCGTSLVSSIDELPSSHELLDKKTLLQSETVALMEGPLGQCREIEKILHKAKVSCAVYPVSLTCDSHNQPTLGASCDMKYMVLIRPDDVSHAREALEGQFLATVLKEGQGNVARGVINLDDEHITCPACQETGPLHDGECPSCGLVLAPPA